LIVLTAIPNGTRREKGENVAPDQRESGVWADLVNVYIINRL